MIAFAPTKKALLLSFLACLTTGHNLFFVALSFAKRSSLNHSLFSFRKSPSFSLFHVRSCAVVETNLNITGLNYCFYQLPHWVCQDDARYPLLLQQSCAFPSVTTILQISTTRPLMFSVAPLFSPSRCRFHLRLFIVLVDSAFHFSHLFS